MTITSMLTGPWTVLTDGDRLAVDPDAAISAAAAVALEGLLVWTTLVVAGGLL